MNSKTNCNTLPRGLTAIECDIQRRGGTYRATLAAANSEKYLALEIYYNAAFACISVLKKGRSDIARRAYWGVCKFAALLRRDLKLNELTDVKKGAPAVEKGVNPAQIFDILCSESNFSEATDILQSAVLGYVNELNKNEDSEELKRDIVALAFKAAKSAANAYLYKARRAAAYEIPAGVAIPEEDLDESIVSLFDKQTAINYARKLNIFIDPNKYDEWLCECRSTIKHFAEIEKAARAGADSIYKIANYLNAIGYSITKSTVQRVNSKAFTLYQKYFEN